jgi:hypothetical protein
VTAKTLGDGTKVVEAKLIREGVTYVLVERSGKRHPVDRVEVAIPGRHVGRFKSWRITTRGIATPSTLTKRDDHREVSGDAGRGKKRR